MIQNNKQYLVLILIIFIMFSLNIDTYAQEGFNIPDVSLDISSPNQSGEGNDLVLSLRILGLLTVLSLAPAIVIMFTSFTRVIIVFSIIKRALSIRNMPPNQVLIGLAIFLTIFIMAPVWQTVNTEALQPYLNEEISIDQAYNRTEEPLRDFMFTQTSEDSIALFVEMSEMERPENQADIPLYVLIPAFLTNEIKIAFQIGFMIYIPFLMIDMIVASILMSMGMMMLPPVIISLPFKILLFVLVDGWHLIINSLVQTF
ncbi:MAG TPA: flagellar type III secretion system pore protein FliP [Halanaerobiales bacterium]|nr:flagellar type III secretion system pore protein FliP [Halanaerobiales bacterium]